jgi:dolichol-phosphate mannosyltransferase
MQWCLDRDYDFLINLDADLSHRPSDTARLLTACQQDGCDVAVASRYQPGGGFLNIALHRRLMSRILNRYANWMLKLPLTDCSGSFRCYRTSALRRIDLGEIKCNGYGFLEEILVALNLAGCRFVEVPIWFDARTLGRSKLTLKDAWGAIKLIHQLRVK